MQKFFGIVVCLGSIGALGSWTIQAQHQPINKIPEVLRAYGINEVNEAVNTFKLYNNLRVAAHTAAIKLDRAAELLRHKTGDKEDKAKKGDKAEDELNRAESLQLEIGHARDHAEFMLARLKAAVGNRQNWSEPPLKFSPAEEQEWQQFQVFCSQRLKDYMPDNQLEAAINKIRQLLHR